MARRHNKFDWMLPERSSVQKVKGEQAPQLATLALAKKTRTKNKLDQNKPNQTKTKQISPRPVTKGKKSCRFYYSFYCKSKCSPRITAVPGAQEGSFLRGKASKEEVRRELR